ncbi:MAG: hypothetical protein EBU90_14370 [Proteobacteria bacterium]|nr:hypothetical protein [Pseudomonadota bacterium]NBP16014.1 hypothetical protein [bacterium]
MAVTTTDVCTNAVSGIETQKNGTVIVSCANTGTYKTITSIDTSISYNTLENKLTNRFDDVTYYTIGNTTIVGA